MCRVWKFGAVYCKVNTFISYLSVTASVFTLLALTVDRRKVLFVMLNKRKVGSRKGLLFNLR
jgi:hypothetical protein